MTPSKRRCTNFFRPGLAPKKSSFDSCHPPQTIPALTRVENIARLFGRVEILYDGGYINPNRKIIVINSIK